MNGCVWGLAGILVGFVAGFALSNRILGSETERTMKSLSNENRALRCDLDRAMAQNERVIQLNKYSDETVSDALKKPSTAELEKLSEQYHDKDFDEHFADRVSPPEDEPEECLFDEPYEITRSEFDLSTMYKRTIRYYTESVVLCPLNYSGKEEAPIQASDHSIGEFVHDLVMDGAKGVRYVRDEYTYTDYMVYILDRFYDGR